jgi:hypothetical protein
MKIYYKPKKNMHNVGNSPNFHSNCLIACEDAPDVLECPLCTERAAQSDDILSAEFLIDKAV